MTDEEADRGNCVMCADCGEWTEMSDERAVDVEVGRSDIGDGPVMRRTCGACWARKAS